MVKLNVTARILNKSRIVVQGKLRSKFPASSLQGSPKVFVAMSRRRQSYGGQAGGARTSKSKRVFVAMSGGVDSSVAALLLKREGYDVTGVFMKCWSDDASLGPFDALRVAPRNSRGGKLGMNCAWERDSEDARRVAGRLGIPFYVWDFEKDYKRRVVEYMVKGYAHGITPNPDVMCNKEIKFGLFLARALAHGADYVATGHYVRLRAGSRVSGIGYRRSAGKKLDPQPYTLFAARDKNKDQSYFLWTLTQEQLRYCLFPIGDYLKPEVRTIARRAKLPTAEKKDSQGICFLGKFSLKDFLKKRIRSRKGMVVTVSGVPVGEHDGAAFYTIGQRRIGVANRGLIEKETRLLPAGRQGITRKDFKPLYVADKDIKTNTLVVVEGDDNPALYKRKICLTGVNFLRLVIDNELPMTVYARVRYRQSLVKATLVCHKLSAISHRLVFTKPVKFIAEGQSAVFYSRQGELLGGGIIV